MTDFQVKNFDLSMESPETGLRLTASVYKVEGIRRTLSIGELVMAVCLARAAEVEKEIVDKMASMAQVTERLETLTKVQESLVTVDQSTGKKNISNWSPAVPLSLTWPVGTSSFQIKNWSDLLTWLKTDESNPQGSAGPGIAIFDGDPLIDDVLSAISSKLDGYNSENQKDMIKLQSQTNKRDQSYDLITNMLKSMHTVIMANANNFAR